MTPPIFALFLTCLFEANMVSTAQRTNMKQLSHFQSHDIGESTTLPCYCDNDVAVMFFWYKQMVGKRPVLLSTFYRHNNNGSFQDDFKNPRFSLESGKQENHLRIADLRVSDSATYYCISSNLYDFKFCEGITVNVKGSGSIKLVHQPASESLQAGDSVTLNCTVHSGSCDGEHSVYWFRHSETSHQGLIYTHGGRNDQCERKPKTQTNTCLYNLPPKNLNLSNYDAYCAVASCGHILFGGEKELKEVKDGVKSLVLVYFLSGALAFTTILTVVLAFLVFKMNKRSGQDSTGIFPSESTPNTVVCQDGENLHYATVLDFKANRSRRKTTTQTECVYSSVRQ
ncbi:uncharacterized protein LOC114451181 [Parambassis ranga]|uniref:Uncharacterized protein LOC114451181 n=1 Tax=Parambassis ranga TaxID=210632 RepID=A0A6P7KAS6_9TELE|nr:uncharacterized protein LOC114451181 [Parambassis ranga]